MQRAPVVLSATVFGTAAVLGFHAHSSAAPTAGVSGSTATSTSGGAASASTAASSEGSTSGARTTTGDAEMTRYGAAQVMVTVKNGKITSVEAVQLQNGDPKSQEISDYADPILQRSVLRAQTAAVDTVSGATYTSLSYEASLQSALDKLGFQAADGSTASTDVSQLQ